MRETVANATTTFAALRWRLAPSGALMPERVARVFLPTLAVILLTCALYLYLFSYDGQGGLRAFAAVDLIGDATAGIGLGHHGGEPCDVFDGAWVPDDTGRYPLYNSSVCPFMKRYFECLANGRNDTSYLKLRWKPRRCDVPRFVARTMLERLRGKRVVIVGDSMSREQWESFTCMLLTGVDDPTTVFEVNGNELTKRIPHVEVRFASHGLNVAFFRCVFLVQAHPDPLDAPIMMDNSSSKWVDSDVLIFNTGHHWTPERIKKSGLKLGTSADASFKMGLETWASWVQKNVDLNRTHVFFRSYEPSHWRDTRETVCEVTEHPSSEAKRQCKSEFGTILADVVTNMKLPITILNVTSMGAYRSDAHVGSWSYPRPRKRNDCDHWCLPGVPDAWNELVFSYLLTNGWPNVAS